MALAQADYFTMVKGFQGDTKTQRARWFPAGPSCFFQAIGSRPSALQFLVHPFHAMAVSAARHSRLFLLLGEFGDHDLGGEHQTRHARGVLKRRPTPWS